MQAIQEEFWQLPFGVYKEAGTAWVSLPHFTSATDSQSIT